VITNVPTTIDSSVITGNDATFGGATGGGVKIDSTSAEATVTDSIVAGNTAESTDASQPGGGGISAENEATVTVQGTTFSGNTVVGGTVSNGGGMLVTGTSTRATIVNSTFSGNEALSPGGSGAGLRSGGKTVVAQTTFGPNPVEPVAGFASALQRTAGTLTVYGSIVETSGASGACSSGLNSLGFNVFTDGTCVITPATGDEANADQQLSALADNDAVLVGRPDSPEPILTQLPAQASTAIDHVSAADCNDGIGDPLLLDQRGLPRPFDGDDNGTADCDAGSVELQTVPPPPPPPGTGGGQPTAQPPVTTPGAKKKCKKAKKGAVAAKKKCKRKRR
jgi:hypothetical protein